ncbi:MAG: HD domain-containing protein, partial [Reichenbachiella sp.]
MTTNKNKIINDPVYGFITIPNDLIFEIIQHPFFQRLRQIKQLGLTSLIYPGALHTRFHHALGSMYLMQQALHSLRSKGIEISDKEFEGCLIAILLHDIGHGPFSHTLEFNLLNDITHEK